MTQSHLKTLIEYDPTTGSITLIKKTSNFQAVGDSLHDRPYINLNGKSYAILKLLSIYLHNDESIKLITLDGTTCYRLSNLFVIGSLSKIPLTQEILKKFLTYDKTTGQFAWKARYIANVKVGAAAGYVTGSMPDGGYVQLSLLGSVYPAHRLAWLYEYGEFPDKQLDHINHNRQDNRIANLREATQHVNMKNKSMYYTNRTGYSGVSPHGDSWKARIGVNGTKVLLGVFKSIEEAIAARKAAEKLLSYHENHGLMSNDYPTGSTLQANGNGNSEGPSA